MKNIRRYWQNLVILIVCLMVPGTAQAKPIHVFILAGQSNAVGSGTIGAYLSQPDTINRYRRNLSRQPDVEFFYEISLNEKCFFLDSPVIYNSGGNWVPLGLQQATPHTSGPLCNPFYNAPTLANGFGPEITLGRFLADHGSNRVAIVKFAVGATLLGDPVRGWMWGGKLHQRLFAVLDSAIGALTARGDSWEIRGVFWMQGESDATDKYHKQVYLTYEENLINLIRSLRNYSHNPSLPFIIGEISPHLGSPAKHEYLVRNAQFNVALNDPFTILVNTGDLEKTPKDEIHYSSQGQLDLGQRFAAAYFYLTQDLPKKSDRVAIAFDWSTESAGFHLANFFGVPVGQPLTGTGILSYYPKTPYYSWIGDYPGAIEFSLSSNQKTLEFKSQIDQTRQPRDRGLDLRLAEQKEGGSLLYKAFGRFFWPLNLSHINSHINSHIKAEVELTFEQLNPELNCGQNYGDSGLLILPPGECFLSYGSTNSQANLQVSGSILTYSGLSTDCPSCQTNAHQTWLKLTNLKFP